MLRWLAGFTVICAILGGGGFLAFQWWQDRAAVPQLADAKQEAGDARVAEGSAEYALDARDIYHAGQERDRQIRERTNVAVAQIRASKGADAPLDPDLVAAVNDGLRLVAAGHDHPRQLPMR